MLQNEAVDFGQINKMQQLALSKYRPDIDGLRAIALLSVAFITIFPVGSRANSITVGKYLIP